MSYDTLTRPLQKVITISGDQSYTYTKSYNATTGLPSAGLPTKYLRISADAQLHVHERCHAPAATSTSSTRGRGKLLHLAMAGHAMITRFDAPWQDVQRIP